MSFKNETANSVSDICELFAKFFTNVYVSDDSRYQTSQVYDNRSKIDLGSLYLSYEDVHNALKKIDVNKGNGPDIIPPIILKNCADSLAAPLQLIFNKSLSSGIFPDRWKISYISPIFKSGSRKNVENYRGVAILPTLGKLFESIVCCYLTDHFKHVISFAQHGFMRGRSIATNLSEFTNCALGVIESGAQLDVVYTDFQKAFDRVRHSCLIKKLNEIGVHSYMLNWIQSYLSNRKQYVKISGWKSSIFPVLSGVPQGSHLGPLMFLIFINDISNIFRNSSCLMYADDLKIFSPIRSITDALNLQHDLDLLSSWCQRNFLYLNVDKCKCMTFHRKKVPIEFLYELDKAYLKRVHEMCDLGLLFDEKLTFVRHIDLAISRAYSMLGFVMRICADFDNPLVLKSLYYAYVRSKLEFGSVVWNPNYESHRVRIESIQKKFLWYVFCKFGWQEYIRFAPYDVKCKLLNIESLSNRRKNSSALFVFDLLSGRIDAPNLLSLIDFNIPSRTLRNHEFLRLQRRRTNYGLSEPIRDMSSIFNDVSHLFEFGLNRFVFRKRLQSLQ